MKKIYKRMISILLIVVMLLGYLPANTLEVNATEMKENFSETTIMYDDYIESFDEMSPENTSVTISGDDCLEIISVNGKMYFHAREIGTAIVSDGTFTKQVTVEKAKVNFIVIMGQSNAGNHFENATSDITNPLGTAYWWGNGKGVNATEPVDYIQPSQGFHAPLLAELYAQSVADGAPVKNVMIWQEGITSKNGKSITSWASSATNTSGTDATATMIKNCTKYYENNSDKYEIVGKGVYWLQGESDTAMDPVQYTQLFMAMWNKLKAAGMEYVAFFRLRRGVYENGLDHMDLQYSTSLSAQIQMVNSNPDMYIATTLTENWTGTEDVEHSIDISNYITVTETYGRSEKYTDAYGNDATISNGILTTTMKTLYGSNNKCHYGKFGYGLIAADAAYNMYRALYKTDVSIVKADTSGQVGEGRQLISKLGTKVELDISEMTEHLSFRPACGSTAGTLEIKITSDGKDITESEGLIHKTGQTYGAIDVELLKSYKNVKIIVTYTLVDGIKEEVVYKLIDRTEEYLEGKTISILGDSISTFTNISNGTAASTTNSTIKNGAVYYSGSNLGVSLNDTWWKQAADELGMEILVNNSWSGSCILKPRQGAGTEGYSDRSINLHDNTGDNAGEEPDIIAVYLGTNDFSYYQSELGKASEVDYDSLITETADGYTFVTPTTSAEAYAVMLYRITDRYPDAEVYCFTLLPRENASDSQVNLLKDFNNTIKEIAKHYGAYVVDLYEDSGILDKSYAFDPYVDDNRVHPGVKGMDAIANTFISSVLSNSKYAQNETIYNVSYDLNNVIVDQGNTYAIRGNKPFNITLSAPAGTVMTVSVQMDGKDVTNQVYSEGKVSINNVGADINIIAKAEVPLKEAKNYRFEMLDGKLVSVADTTNTENKLSSASTGVYNLSEKIILYHDRKWVVEWKASGAESFMALASNADPATNGSQYMYKSGSGLGLIAFGFRENGQYHNYGISLKSVGIDWTQEHVYRMINQVNEDGSNYIYLYVDGKNIGTMTDYYLAGTSLQNQNNTYLSGKDFVYSHIGASTFEVNAGKMTYLQVWEDGIPTVSTTMKFDDHLDVSGKSVEIVNKGTPTSFKVGYGVKENILDDAVVKLEEDMLVATGIGTAKVHINGVIYEITVEPAPISFMLLAGQSNMQGIDGNAKESIICPTGQVYATYADRYKKTVEDITKFAPSALTGQYSQLNVTGDTTCLSDFPVNMLTEVGNGREGMDSGLAYEWVQQTGEKIWVINVGYGGSSINEWLKDGTHYEACLELIKACQETLQKEIAAGHYTLSHMGYFWCQGCADELQTAQWYADKFQIMHQLFKAEMSFDHDSNPSTQEKEFEFAGIIPIRSGHEGRGSYRAGAYLDTTTVPYYQSFKDLRMNGPRVAQYWMGNNPELTDIWNVCTIQEEWATMPDGTDGVSEYFASKYENGIVDYQTQVKQSASWYKPTTPAAVHDNIHYNQIGYNEIGRETARNTLIYLDEKEEPEMETKVEFVGWDGFTNVNQVIATPIGSSGTLVVPMVTPVYKSKDVTYQLSEGLKYNYYDILSDSILMTGMLTAVGANGNTVSVVEKTLTSYRWKFDNTNLVSDTSYGDSKNNLAKISGTISNGVFSNLLYLSEQPIVLLHDKAWVVEWIMNHVDSNAGGSMILSSESLATSGEPYIYFRPVNDFIGIGLHNGSNYIHYGYWLSDFGIDMSDGVHTYRLVNRIENNSNMIHLFVDGEEIGPLNQQFQGSTLHLGESDWINGKDFTFQYLGTSDIPLKGFVMEDLVVSEVDVSEDVHFHNYSKWEIMELPTKDELGVEYRICSGCGDKQERELEGVWQKNDFASHYQELPQNVCSGTNLWNSLEHDAEYFTNGTDWGVHSSGNVYSITFAVNEGDKIYATSFGAGGTNGSTSNGIRMSYFDDLGLVKTMSPAETYAEFSKNGYLTVPEGVKYINIPMWTNSDAWEVYNLSLEHEYDGVSCVGCEEKHPNLENFEGKVVSVLGDSISTFRGYIPTADGFNLNHANFYPSGVIQTVEQTWWMQVINGMSMKLGINDSWSGSRVLNTITGNSGNLGEDAAMASLTRIQNLSANGTPDVILFFGGTNDVAHGNSLGKFDSSMAPTEVDLTSTKWSTYADAYVAAIMRMKHFYPEAEIVAISPTENKHYYDAEKLSKYVAIMEAICEYYDVKFVDLVKSGFTTDMLADSTHPNVSGMQCIAKNVQCTLLENTELNKGENVVYSVTHSLEDATTTKHYYKGISAGQDFSEEITPMEGRKFELTITIGGKEITGYSFENGVLTIPKEIITGDVVITTKHAHVYKTEVTEPTCTTKGYTTYTCSVCNNNYKDSYVNALGHSFIQYVGDNNATCTTDGTKTAKCERCDVTDTVTDVGSTIGHSFSEWKIVTGTTCTNDGVEQRECNNCDHYETRVVKSNGHDYSEKTIVPTCTEQGYALHTCSVCNDNYKDAHVNALGHSFAQYVSDNNATCTSDGTKTAKCERCDVTDTITDTGSATGHALGYWQVVTPSTCTTEGLKQRECDNCDYLETKVIPAKEHSYVAKITTATCTTNGFVTYICSRCNDSYIVKTVDPTGHSLREWQVLSNSTCETEGLKKRTCRNCDYFEVMTIPATGHSYVMETIQPTCTVQGYNHYICEVCEHDYKDYFGEALGHEFSDWKEVIPSTCIVEGEAHRECNRCNHVEVEAIPVVDHEFTLYVSDNNATPDMDGTMTAQCNNCTVKDTIVQLGSKLEVIRLEITSMPRKTEYVNGEALQLSDMVVVAYFDNGTSVELQDYKVVGYNNREIGKQTVIISYKGKYDSFEVTVCKKPIENLSSSVYTVENHLIRKVVAGTTVNKFLGAMEDSDYIQVLQNNKEVSSKELIATGMFLKLYDGIQVKDSATVIVEGDVNGDGKITVTDMLMLKAHILGRQTLLIPMKYAGDLNSDGNITITDYIMIRKYILMNAFY